MKNKPAIISLIVILSILAIAVLFFFIFLLKGNIKFFNFKMSYKISNELVFDETYDNDIDKINIDANMMDINIKNSKDEKIKVEIFSNKENTNVNLDDKELQIASKREECFGFCFSKTIPKIDIYLPSNYDKEIVINNKYGDVKIEELLNAVLKINEDCGDIDISKIKEADITNNYGDIDIKEVLNVKINASAGDIKIGKVKNSDLHNSYGDIDIESVNNYLNIEADCGDVKINNLFLSKDSSIKNNFGDIEIGNTDEIYIDAKTSLGEVEINQNFRNAANVLKINNDCGDIIVNN